MYHTAPVARPTGCSVQQVMKVYHTAPVVKKVYHTVHVARPTNASVGWIRLGRESPWKLAYLRVRGKNDCSVFGLQQMGRCL